MGWLTCAHVLGALRSRLCACDQIQFWSPGPPLPPARAPPQGRSLLRAPAGIPPPASHPSSRK
eukprot:6126441-Pyramimonas_sp.AAC.1